jgi:segregation and condensation protein B
MPQHLFHHLSLHHSSTTTPEYSNHSDHHSDNVLTSFSPNEDSNSSNKSIEESADYAKINAVSADSNSADTTPPTSFLALSRSEQRACVEALLFASEEPLSLAMLAELLIQPLAVTSDLASTPITQHSAESLFAVAQDNHTASDAVSDTPTADALLPNTIQNPRNNHNVSHHSPSNSPDRATSHHASHHAQNTTVYVQRLIVEPPDGVTPDDILQNITPANTAFLGSADLAATGVSAHKPSHETLLPDSSHTNHHASHVATNASSVATTLPEEQALIAALIEELNADFERTGRVFRIIPVALSTEAKLVKPDFKLPNGQAPHSSAVNSNGSHKQNHLSETNPAAPQHNLGYQFATTPKHGELLARMVKSKSKKRLSQAALETLAIIAYRQPVSKPEVEVIRGVNSSEVINKLLERNLITIVGRAETVGKPLLYGTTDEFLRLFGLTSLEGLPKPRELEELMENRTDIIEAIQTAKEATALAVAGTKNTLQNTMPEQTIAEIATHKPTSNEQAQEATLNE